MLLLSEISEVLLKEGQMLRIYQRFQILFPLQTNEI